MMDLRSICRRRRPLGPPGTPRPRRSRAFAAGLGLLEGRALLSFVGPTLATTPTASVDFIGSLPAGPDHHDGPSNSDPNAATSGNGPGSPTSHDRNKNHVAMAVLNITVDGRSTPEFALADYGTNQIVARVGLTGASKTLGPADGVNHPQAVTLADLNNDTWPDMIVANSGGNNVLVFPGRPGGLFGPEINGGRGVSVGQTPVSVTVNYVDGDPSRAQLIVSNKDSNSVTILDAQFGPGGLGFSPSATIGTPSGPVTTLVYDVNKDGNPDLFVCNSGPGSVTMYPGRGDGNFDPTPSATFAVGANPSGVFIGQFLRGLQQPELVAVNSGSDSLTFITDPFGVTPTTQTLWSGGSSPDAAFVFDPGQTGLMGLLVANGGDGRLALFQGAGNTLRLAGVIAPSRLPIPTALAPASLGDGLDFFAASAGDDAALLLHFDLGVASTYLPSTSEDARAIATSDEDLFAQLLPVGDASLELVAVFWAGGNGEDSWGDRASHEPSTITAMYTPTEGQGAVAREASPEGPAAPPGQDAPTDEVEGETSLWARFVLGVDDALGLPRESLGAVAERDLEGSPLDHPIEELARLDLPEVEAAASVVDEALRAFWSGDPAPAPAAPASPALQLEGIDEPSPEVRLETLPLVSSAVVVSARLLLKASPPRPPLFRRKPSAGRFVSLANDPKAARPRESL